MQNVSGQSPIQAPTPVSAPAPSKPSVTPAKPSTTGGIQPNPKAFQTANSGVPALPGPEQTGAQIQATPSAKMCSAAAKLPLPKGLAQALAVISGQGPTQGVALTNLGDRELVQTLMRSEDVQGCRFTSIRRDASEIERSGVLEDFKHLASRNLSVPASEFDRSLEDDAVLVMTDFAKMSPQQIHELKEAAYKHPEVQKDLPKAIERGYYGSDQHKQYGAIVEALTGGVISAEEAMAMNPTGGIPGPGANEVPLVGSFDAGLRHAMRHDATGFLITRFNVGPGYGSENTVFALGKNNPLSGQVLGLLREAVGSPSELPNFQYVAQSGRYRESGLA